MFEVMILTPDLSDKRIKVHSREAKELIANIGSKNMSWKSYSRIIELIVALDAKTKK